MEHSAAGAMLCHRVADERVDFLLPLRLKRHSLWQSCRMQALEKNPPNGTPPVYFGVVTSSVTKYARIGPDNFPFLLASVALDVVDPVPLLLLISDQNKSYRHHPKIYWRRTVFMPMSEGLDYCEPSQCSHCFIYTAHFQTAD